MIDVLPLLLGPEGYQISRSVRLRSSASAYFNRTLTTPTSGSIWTYSLWVKRGALNSNQQLLSAGASVSDQIYFQGGGTDKLIVYLGASQTTTQVFRDPSAWYHFVFAVDTTQATASNRLKIYLNGSQITAFDATGYPTQNSTTKINSAVAHYIGRYAASASDYVDGYLTEVNFIDGQALTPSSFGQTNGTTGVWSPIKYTGTYGNNGFYLNFSDNSAATAAAIGKDYSGNGNNWTPNNISVTSGSTYDSMLDVPTPWGDGGNGRGNYCTLNPLSYESGTYTLSNANLTYAGARTASATAYIRSTISVSSGKWYWEAVATNVGAGPNLIIGVQDASTSATTGLTNTVLNGYGYNGAALKFDNAGSASYGATWTNGDVIGIALDLDAGTITFYKNNVSQGIAYSSISGTYCPVIVMTTAGVARTIAGSINFGQRPFSYTPPTGFKALNTLNLPTPTILKGNQYFDATLWSGNSTNARVITTNVGTVDFAWVKRRNGIDDHRLANTVTGGNRHLKSNATDAESTGTTVIQAFSGSTFTLGTDGSVNATGGTYVGWTWSEGATQGFDIVTYTGNGGTQNISHNLGVAPRMMIVKSRSVAQRWTVYHASVSNAYIYLNETFAADTANAALRFGNNSAVVQPTSSVFTIGNSVDVNQNTTTYVAYLFAAVAGYSAFGSYTGNGSTDGPMVFTGFLPRWVMVKRTDAAGQNWVILDTSRDTSNVAKNGLYPNLSNAEDAGWNVDILSNGFKPRDTASAWNASGGTYVYACFASSPFKNSLAR